MSNLHKVFISFHSVDINYKNEFERLFHDTHQVIISRAVNTGDIPDNLQTETVRQKIRDEYLRDSSVTVVLIGAKTWQRKHVDWEIASSIRDTQNNPLSGLLGIILPTYPGYSSNNYYSCTIPPRLFENIECGYAKIYNWTKNPNSIQEMIHEAYLAKGRINPTNAYPSFAQNRSSDKWSY